MGYLILLVVRSFFFFTKQDYYEVFQVIEGPELVTEALFETILKDKRHNVYEVKRYWSYERCFKEWGMILVLPFCDSNELWIQSKSWGKAKRWAVCKNKDDELMKEL